MGKKLLVKLQRGRLSKVNCKLCILSIGGLLLLSLMLVSLSMAADATEYEASAVDSPPKIVRRMPVTYPSEAKRNKVEGRVVVRCLIGSDGKADKMEIAESEPAGVFDDAALKTLKYWQFRPGILKGALVATWVKIPFNFSLN